MIYSINIILVLHRNFIPNNNLGLLENWEHITIAFEPSHRVFMNRKRDLEAVTVVLWTSSHILYGLPLHQKGNVSKATC